MIKSEHKQQQKDRRHRRIRSKVKGTADRPRVSVFRSNKFIYAQLIDDASGTTMLASSSKDLKLKENKAVGVGEDLAKKAQAVGIKTVVFDRSGYRYAGQIKALADALRDGGLEF